MSESPSLSSSYLTRQMDHFGVCHSFEVSALGTVQNNYSEHEGFEICFGFRRAQTFEVRGRNWKAAPGEIILYNALERHGEIYPKNCHSEYSGLVLSSRVIDQMLEGSGMSAREIAFEPVLLRSSRETQSLIDQLAEFRRFPYLQKESVDSASASLAYLLLDQVPHSHSARLERRSRTGHYPSLVTRAKQVLRDQMSDPKLDLRALSRQTGTSVFHLVRTFKRSAGTTPIQYLNRLRMNQAVSLLIGSKKSITEIALEVGFEELTTFQKAFKKVFGRAPSKWRQMSQEQQFFPGHVPHRKIEPEQ